MTRDYPLNSLDDIGFVCIEAKYDGKWVLCFHSRRRKWECPGGHAEAGETPLAAAKRELWEETGAADFDIVPVWDYQALNGDGSVHNNGRVYYAEINSFGALPECSEMERIDFFDELPENVTYDRDKMIDMLTRAETCAAEIRHVCCCGYDCSKCPVYLATVQDSDELRMKARRFYLDELKLDIPLSEIRCLGGRSKNPDDMLGQCKSCPWMKCCGERGLYSCEECGDYPCPPLSSYIDKYVNKNSREP